jgi:short-subunit dehydrogenase
MTTAGIRPLALVTGASAGIGAAIARQLAARGYDLALVARREDRLREVAEQLQGLGAKSWVLPADLGDPATPARLVAALESDCPPVQMLVNNAGYGLATGFRNTEWSVHASFMQVLLHSNVELVHRLLPGMLQRGSGRIGNIASLAALVPDMPGSLYSAVKKFMVSFTHSLRGELRGTGVTATAICPGFTHSEFHDVLGNRSAMDRLPRLVWMDAATVAQRSVAAIEAGRAVLTPGLVNQLVAGLCRVLPSGIVRCLMPRDLMAATERRSTW